MTRKYQDYVLEYLVIGFLHCLLWSQENR